MKMYDEVLSENKNTPLHKNGQVFVLGLERLPIIRFSVRSGFSGFGSFFFSFFLLFWSVNPDIHRLNRFFLTFEFRRTVHQNFLRQIRGIERLFSFLVHRHYLII